MKVNGVRGEGMDFGLFVQDSGRRWGRAKMMRLELGLHYGRDIPGRL